MTFLLAAAAGAFGALARYLLSGVVQEGTRSNLPVGTLSVNLLGAFLLGLVAGIDRFDSLPTIAAAGFLAGLTTFSTWMIETIRLGIAPVTRRAVLNLTIPLIAGIALAWIGYSLTG
jgi:fluoride exporter